VASARVTAAVVDRPTSDDRIRAALWFADHGFGVFSVWSTLDDGSCRCPKGKACDNAGKHPIGGQGFKDATADPERIRKLLSAGSEPNYGLVCPDGVFVLDVDGDGIDRLKQIGERLGRLPFTLTTRTANGWHVFLRWPAGHPRPIGQLWGLVTRWGSGQNAGYVIGPRSVHASGAVYEPAGGTTEIATLPERWAADAITAPEPDVFIQIESGGYELPDFGFTGSRYNEILRFLGSRYMKGIPLEEIWVGVVYSLAPRFEHPLAEQELRSRFERAWKGTAAKFGPPGALPTAAAIIELPAGMPAPPPVNEPSWPAPIADAAWHGVLGEIVDAVTPRTEADPVAILGTLLAATGACMGRDRVLYQGSEQATNLFIALVGDSSVGRKGTAASIGRDVMTAAYPDWERLIVTGLGSGEGLVAHLKARTTDPDESKRDHRALVLETEFGRLLTVMAREGSTLSPVIRDAWDGSAIGRFIAREQSLVPFHHVSLAAHVTSVELRQKLASVDAANGFGNRFLWLAVRRTQLIPFPESPKDLIGPLVGPLHQAIVSARLPGTMRWTPEAADRWEALYAVSSASRLPGLLGALTARREAQTARLALLYALLDRAGAVGAEHLAAGEAVWDYAERSAVHLFGVSTGNRRADQLLILLRDGPVDWMGAKKELGVRESTDLQEAVDVLVGAGLATLISVRRQGGGRPLRVIAAGDGSDQRVTNDERTHPPAQTPRPPEPS
jgi:hypothetical protein